MNCHDGHEVIEIWTRRHFRCDCGNSKFGIVACKLYSSKEPENEENVYNKNYKGVYCTCNRPYPDPDAAEDMGEMLQCCVCEDWFHEGHLGLSTIEEVPRDDEGEPTFDEIICQVCAESLDFLSHYAYLFVPTIMSNSSCKEVARADVSPANEGSEIVEIVHNDSQNTVETGSPGKVEVNTLLKSSSTIRGEVEGESSKTADITSIVVSSKNESVEQDFSTEGHNNSNGTGERNADCSNTCHPSGLLSGEASGCILKSAMASNSAEGETPSGWTAKAVFLKKNWRSQLCRCTSCLEIYRKKGVSFLMDPNDTIAKYEEIAKQKRKEKMDSSNGRDLSFLNGMSHVGQIEFLHGLNQMTSELSAFFASFEPGKPITSADIYEVFENLNKKRARHK
ncbi:hypothetical protein KP509_02G009500 [Ceratopteris richardii]|nr:hypothetical protein KP509_02G009500 [Ceratopteris richardii]